ncbi:hypothetical protein BD310DRAFT_332132 [Dichomitus squalens]|uniref:Uncharacterized protein n=1 Tax=Dichomitus squalens TaxID=114155 RepID=A0A4V2K8L1_9APHY|nr:hypothetical protein BD310DRAFT_332132 [Dichomitus squalens]
MFDHQVVLGFHHLRALGYPHCHLTFYPLRVLRYALSSRHHKGSFHLLLICGVVSAMGRRVDRAACSGGRVASRTESNHAAAPDPAVALSGNSRILAFVRHRWRSCDIVGGVLAFLLIICAHKHGFTLKSPPFRIAERCSPLTAENSSATLTSQNVSVSRGTSERSVATSSRGAWTCSKRGITSPLSSSKSLV